MPPYILYQATNLWALWTQGGPPGARYQTSPSGWMESLLFFDWFKTMFVPHVATQPGHKLLIFDGHNSHISLAVVNCALANNISIVCLPPHSSHCLQPLDKGVFGPAKTQWRSILQEFYKRTRQANVDKATFPSLIKLLYERAFKPIHAISGFRACGIYPLDPSSIDPKYVALSEPHIAPPLSTEESQATPPATPTTTRSIRLKSATPSSATNLVETSAALQQSILTHLRVSSPRPITGRAIRIERSHYGMSITEEEAKSAIEAAEKKRLEKETAKAAKALAKQLKDTNSGTRKRPLQAGPIPDSIPQAQTSIRSCGKCKKAYESENDWRACEGCSKWLCGKCLPKKYQKDASLEFFCTRKCSA